MTGRVTRERAAAEPGVRLDLRKAAYGDTLSPRRGWVTYLEHTLAFRKGKKTE